MKKCSFILVELFELPQISEFDSNRRHPYNLLSKISLSEKDFYFSAGFNKIVAIVEREALNKLIIGFVFLLHGSNMRIVFALKIKPIIESLSNFFLVKVTQLPKRNMECWKQSQNDIVQIVICNYGQQKEQLDENSTENLIRYKLDPKKNILHPIFNKNFFATI